jgi:hypothetical protein
MWIGFHDDPSFRWSKDRADLIESSAAKGASVMRLLVHWNATAPRRPAKPADPLDPAYDFGDLDEAVRNAQKSDLEVLLTLYGTPGWANGGRGANAMPGKVKDFKYFAQAIASRYSGRFEEYPYVRFWSVWNEPNLQVFLKPQFDKRGNSVAPRNYAKLYAAAHAGIKAGNPTARVGIGETSARGSDNPKGKRPIHSPGKFAEMLARANPRLKFDAWSHHPYPFVPNLRPSQKVRWPNVTLASLPVFQKHLKRWFGRRTVEVWVTEYGHQTRPQDRLGISYKKQAQYIRQSIAIARKQHFVSMFVWFVYQDDPGQPWESGLYTRTGSPKGNSPPRFARAARPLDARNAILNLKRGAKSPPVILNARRQCAANKAGTSIDVSWRVTLGGRVVRTGEQSSPLRPDCTIRLRLQGFTLAGKRPYTARLVLADPDGKTRLTRQLTLRGV